MSRKKAISTVIALGISAVFLWIAFQNIDMSELGNAFASINWLFAIPFVAVTWLSFVWRCLRWKRLLESTSDVTVRETYGPLMIGFGFNSIFPLRIGEIARPLALKKQAGVPMTTGLSTVFVERVFDVLALLGFFVFCTFFIQFDEGVALQYREYSVTPATVKGIINTAAVGASVLFVGCVLMMSERFRNLVLKVIETLPLIPEGLRERLQALFGTFAAGFNSLRHPRRVTLIALDTIGIWLMGALTFWIMALGFPGIELSFLNATIFLVVTCVLIALPAAPGYWGAYEVGGILALVLTGVVANSSMGEAKALSYTLTVHFLQWALVTVLGLYYAAKIHVSAKDAARLAEQQPA